MGQPLVISINAQKGMGDNIYHRPLVFSCCLKYDVVELKTPWPQLFHDMPDNLVCLPASTRLRTQKKNIARSSFGIKDSRNVNIQKTITPRYRINDLRNKNLNVFEVHEKHLLNGYKVFKYHMDHIPRDWYTQSIKVFKDLGVDPHKPFSLIRSATVREEWNRGKVRNCRPEYLQIAADRLKEIGSQIIEIADLEEGREFLVGDPIACADARAVKGEMYQEVLMWAFQNCYSVVSSLGFPLGLSQMLRTPALMIEGGHDNHRHFTDKRITEAETVFVSPEDRSSCCVRGCYSRGCLSNKIIKSSDLQRSINQLIERAEHRLHNPLQIKKLVTQNVEAIREQQQLDRSDVPPVPRSVRIRPLQQ
jgi:hypothetical protein